MPEALIYPLIRKIDVISSNSYLISTSDVILLIDPGGLSGQGEHLSGIIADCRVEKDRPVFVFLTHAHIDHFQCVQSNPAFTVPGAVIFAAHHAGAQAIEAGDVRITQADLLQQPLSRMKIPLHLFTPWGEDPAEASQSICFPGGTRISILRDQMSGDLPGLPHERIVFGSGPALDLYHTPGHSPDSICLRMGNLLFSGDLLFAANPGLAGVTGWSQEALVASLSGMEQLVAGGGVTVVCPGHGRVIPAPDAVRMFSRVRADADALSDIAELNRERASKTAEYAEECMEQVNELFTIMAGRLSYVTYILDELGESGMAEEVSVLIQSDTIEELLDAFRDFSEKYQLQSPGPVPLMLKAGQVMAKLDKTFQKNELAGIIDPTMVRRASRLLADYTTMLRGFTLPGEIVDHDLIPVSESIVTGLSVPVLSDEAVLCSPDDDGAFARILLTRIGSRPLLEEVQCNIFPEQHAIRALIDSDLYADLMTYILENLVGVGAEVIEICIRQRDRDAMVMIKGTMAPLFINPKRRTEKFLKGLSERAGGTLTIDGDDREVRYKFTAGTP
jgi:glyoxylase-like metal-dependent hydrolase (beta-lactamase superfamily II)